MPELDKLTWSQEESNKLDKVPGIHQHAKLLLFKSSIFHIFLDTFWFLKRTARQVWDVGWAKERMNLLCVDQCHQWFLWLSGGLFITGYRLNIKLYNCLSWLTSQGKAVQYSFYKPKTMKNMQLSICLLAVNKTVGWHLSSCELACPPYESTVYFFLCWDLNKFIQAPPVLD